MRDYIAKFWGFLFVLLFVSLFVGCDVEYLEYEDDDTYALFDRPGMAPATTLELAEALTIIDAGGTFSRIPWAYKIIADTILVASSPPEGYWTVVQEDISFAPFTIAEITTILEELDEILEYFEVSLPEDVVICMLRRAITEFNKPDFDVTARENAAIVAVVYSLENLGTTSADEVDRNTKLSHGDFLLLAISIHQSQDPPAVNRLAALVKDCLGGISLNFPGVEPFVEPFTEVDLLGPHQGVLSGG